MPSVPDAYECRGPAASNLNTKVGDMVEKARERAQDAETADLQERLPKYSRQKDMTTES